jgi:hypothetical protein
VDGSQDFSRTAYNMQVSSGDRSKMSAKEVEDEGIAALGWKQYQNYLTQMQTEFGKYGMTMDDPEVKDVKRAMIEYLKQTNGPWAKQYSDRQDKFGYYYSQAQALSQDKRLANRSDMVAFRDYDQARQQVMDYYGLKSLSGTGPDSQDARAILAQAGKTLADKDFGFQQMWSRFLSGEVDG